MFMYCLLHLYLNKSLPIQFYEQPIIEKNGLNLLLNFTDFGSLNLGVIAFLEKLYILRQSWNRKLFK